MVSNYLFAALFGFYNDKHQLFRCCEDLHHVVTSWWRVTEKVTEYVNVGYIKPTKTIGYSGIKIIMVPESGL
jgi:hypothetical protein